MIKTVESDDLYSISQKGYNTLDYAIKILVDNGIVSINDPIESQKTLVVDNSLYYRNNVPTKTKKEIVLDYFTLDTTYSQTWYDIALMGCGTLDAMVNIIVDNSRTDINNTSI